MKRRAKTSPPPKLQPIIALEAVRGGGGEPVTAHESDGTKMQHNQTRLARRPRIR